MNAELRFTESAELTVNCEDLDVDVESRHEPPLRHGDEAHSSMSVSQNLPE
jgi:hypothetical protein